MTPQELFHDEAGQAGERKLLREQEGKDCVRCKGQEQGRGGCQDIGFVLIYGRRQGASRVTSILPADGFGAVISPNASSTRCSAKNQKGQLGLAGNAEFLHASLQRCPLHAEARRSAVRSTHNPPRFLQYF